MKNKYKAFLLLTTLLMFNLVIAFSADAIFADKTAYAIENNASELMVLLGGFILSNIFLLFLVKKYLFHG